MDFSHVHKTVFVLDHGPEFARSSKQTMDFDSVNAARRQGMIPLAPVIKSLWTCSVESCLEFCRIIHDIFPKTCLVELISSDIKAQVLNSWQVEDQILQRHFASVGHVGPPSTSKDFKKSSITYGLEQAVEELCQPTEKQHEVRTSLTEDASNVKNKGRIICLTSVKSLSDAKKLEECVLEAIKQNNRVASSSDNLMPIDYCELTIINIIAVGDKSNIESQDKTDVSPFMSCEVTTSESGVTLANRVVELTMKLFDLALTSVTGIPMKEEQNASSSANYDVEILHPAITHKELFATGQSEGLLLPSRDIANTQAVTLKWCTPKTSAAEFYQCTTAFRISPIDVNSRPSSCLTNFLLSGRSVMLEQPRKTGIRVVSHMLTSHGGEIYIKTLHTARSILEDPPSISEGCGGRVTDYRITDFGEVMKEYRLAPVLEPNVNELPIDRARSVLERSTRYWPMVIGETLIFNMLSHLDPLPSLIVKEKLDDDDVLECKKAIYHIVGMESRNEALPVPNIGTRAKGNTKRDEMYRQMWSELETLIRAHVDTSPEHEKILECVLECRKPVDDVKSRKSSERSRIPNKEEKMDLSETEMATKELNRYQQLTEREKLELNTQEVKKALSTQPPKKFKPNPIDNSDNSAGPQNLLSIWTNKMKAIHSKRHEEFAGRLESVGNQAELYVHLKDDDSKIKIQNQDSTRSKSPGIQNAGRR